MDRRAVAIRLGAVVLGLVALAAAIAVALGLAGRDARPALAGGCGVVGLLLVVAGIAILGLARGGSSRVTTASAFGTLALSAPFLIASLII